MLPRPACVLESAPLCEAHQLGLSLVAAWSGPAFPWNSTMLPQLRGMSRYLLTISFRSSSTTLRVEKPHSRQADSSRIYIILALLICCQLVRFQLAGHSPKQR